MPAAIAEPASVPPIAVRRNRRLEELLSEARVSAEPCVGQDGFGGISRVSFVAASFELWKVAMRGGFPLLI